MRDIMARYVLFVYFSGDNVAVCVTDADRARGFSNGREIVHIRGGNDSMSLYDDGFKFIQTHNCGSLPIYSKEDALDEIDNSVRY